MSPRQRSSTTAKPSAEAALIKAMRAPEVAAALWYRTTVGGVWYLDVGDRLAVVYGARGGAWWWRAPGAALTEARSQAAAQLEAQAAVLAWCLAGRWTERRKRAAKRFVPTKADRAAADQVAPELTTADIDKALAEAPEIIREVRDQLAPYVSPP